MPLPLLVLPPSGGRDGRGAYRGRDHVNTGTNGQELLHVLTTDSDFESSNAKFDKAALAASSKANSAVNGDEGGSEPDTSGQGAEGESQKEKSSPVAYNPFKSFFDLLSSSAHPSAEASTTGTSTGNVGAGGSGGRRRRGRERNMATFGEPGGIGLMGPGAYIGGWGGYGDRGGAVSLREDDCTTTNEAHIAAEALILALHCPSRLKIQKLSGQHFPVKKTWRYMGAAEETFGEKKPV